MIIPKLEVVGGLSGCPERRNPLSICNMDCFNCPYEDCINDKNAENRARYWKDVEESRRKKREWYKNNREKALASQKKYDDANREKIRQYQREYYHRKKQAAVAN